MKAYQKRCENIKWYEGFPSTYQNTVNTNAEFLKKKCKTIFAVLS